MAFPASKRLRMISFSWLSTHESLSTTIIVNSKVLGRCDKNRDSIIDTIAISIFLRCTAIQERLLTRPHTPQKAPTTNLSLSDFFKLVKTSKLHSPPNPPNYAPTKFEQFSSPPPRRRHCMASVRTIVRNSATLRSSHRSSSG